MNSLHILLRPGSETGQAFKRKKERFVRRLLHVSTASKMGSHVATRVHRHVC